MNIDTFKLNDFLSDLVNSQTSLSQTVANCKNKKEVLKQIKDINVIITLLYNLKESIEKDKP